MSIAVSAIVRPASVLRYVHAGFCLAVAASGIGVGGWQCALCVLGGLAGWSRLRGASTPLRIDISGVGQIRLTVYLQDGARRAVASTGGAAQEAPLRLLAGSTIWPGLLLLRLGRAGAPAALLTVLPGSVAPGAFRRLALACRVLSARGGPDGAEQ